MKSAREVLALELLAHFDMHCLGGKSLQEHWRSIEPERRRLIREHAKSMIAALIKNNPKMRRHMISPPSGGAK